MSSEAEKWLAETNWAGWVRRLHDEIIEPARNRMLRHQGLQGVVEGRAQKSAILQYFSGLLWHLRDFDKHVAFLMKKRPQEVDALMVGRSEDQDGSLDSLVRPVEFFGGNASMILETPWAFKPHPVWIHHDAMLRSCIYSQDFEWQVGAAALNVGIESFVPDMVGALMQACHQSYGFGGKNAEWLESRSGEEERQHGENGYIILNKFVEEGDVELISKCKFFIRALSDSMSRRLFSSTS